MKAILAIIFAIVAFVAQSEAAYCRHSAYKMPCSVVARNKVAMFRACGFRVLTKPKAKLAANEVYILGQKSFASSGCCQYRQRVMDAATWNTKYKNCEEAHALYLNPNGAVGSMKGTKGACSFLAFSGTCK